MANQKYLDTLQFACLFAVAFALVPAGAHLFVLPNKIAMAPEQYMAVQDIYRGWALFGIVLISALMLAIAHAVAVRADGRAALFSLITVFCVVANLIIFFLFTYPMNVASANWTVIPPDFASARRQWEYSHAVNAVIMFVAFASMAASVLISRSRRIVV